MTMEKRSALLDPLINAMQEFYVLAGKDPEKIKLIDDEIARLTALKENKKII